MVYHAILWKIITLPLDLSIELRIFDKYLKRTRGGEFDFFLKLFIRFYIFFNEAKVDRLYLISTNEEFIAVHIQTF